MEMKSVYLHKADDIDALVGRVNGRAASHTLARGDLLMLASRAEKTLTGSGVPKSLWRGVRVIYQPAGPGKSYARKGRHVMTNRAVLEYRAGGWALVQFDKIEGWADCGETFLLHVSEAVLERVRAEAVKAYAVPA
jgi:hypothetical protein